MNPVADESRLTAYALGELNDADRATVERELNEHPELRAEVEQIRALAETLTRELDREAGVPLDELRREAIRQAAQTPARKPIRRSYRFAAVLGAVAALLLMAFVLVRTRPGLFGIGGAEVAASSQEFPIALATKESGRELEVATQSYEYSARVAAHDPHPGPAATRGNEPAYGLKDLRREAELSDSLASAPVRSAHPEPVDRFKAPLEKKEISDVLADPALAISHPRPILPNPGMPVGQGSTASRSLLTVHAGMSVAIGEDRQFMDYDDESRRPEGIISPSLDDFPERTDQPFLRVADHPLSTFSVDVDTASYSVVRKLLTEGQLPPRDAVRVEEMINYFTYEAAPPRDGQAFAAHLERMPSPWNPRHPLVRITLKGRELSQETRPALNLVYLVDVSGSMNADNKLPLAKRALQMLAGQLEERDRIAIVVYAGASGLALPSTTGARRNEIVEALDRLDAGGGTAGAAGIQLAYQVARENFRPGAENRVILCTDGDFNVGVTQRGDLERLIEQEAKSGVFLSVLGFGMGNYKDSTLELLSGKGNGNYAYIDTFAEARKVLVDQMFGTLVTIAKDVKIQVEFNPARVAGYRLIGYENRMLRKEDFNNDRIDAGDIGAGHTVTALYELVPVGQPVNDAPAVDDLKYGKPAPASAEAGSGEWLTVKLRHKAPDGDVSSKQEFPLKDNAGAEASRDFRFAAAVAAFGQRLRGTTHLGAYSYDQILALAEAARGEDPLGYRVEFIKLVHNARALAGNAAEHDKRSDGGKSDDTQFEGKPE